MTSTLSRMYRAGIEVFDASQQIRSHFLAGSNPGETEVV